jgi:hypothetical protein
VPVPDGAPLLTLNTARGRIHWRKWALLTAAWREQSRLEAEASGRPADLGEGRVTIEALPVQAGGILADPGAHMPTLKAIVDGLRDAGWLPDDSGRYVEAVTMFPPVKGTPGMVVDLIAAPVVGPEHFG